MNITITVKATPDQGRATTTPIPCAGLSADALKNTVLRTVTAVQRMTALDGTPRAVVIDVRQADARNALADVCVRMTQENMQPIDGRAVANAINAGMTQAIDTQPQTE